MPANPTPAQSRASRLNGARSRGPRTQEGRARIARAATRHGILGEFFLLPGEERPFRRLRAAWRARLSPRDAAEAAAVDKLVAAIWRERRLEALESRLSAALARGEASPGLPSLATLLRYRARIERDRRRALAELAFARRLAARQAHRAESAAAEVTAFARARAPSGPNPAVRGCEAVPSPIASAFHPANPADEPARARASPAAAPERSPGREAGTRGLKALLGEAARELRAAHFSALKQSSAGGRGLCDRLAGAAPRALLAHGLDALDALLGSAFGAPLTGEERARLAAAAGRGMARARPERRLQREPAHSHSMVPGGLEVTS